MEWKKVRLGDIAKIISGVNYDKQDIGNNGSIRILRGSNIQNGEIVYRDDDVMLPAKYKSDENSVKYGDTCITASTGSIELLGKGASCFEQLQDIQIGAFMRIIRPMKIEDAVFISCVVRGDLYSQYIKRINGTSINNITKSYLENLPLYYPDAATLSSISKVVFSIDRKIALNRAINHNLEAMAKQLYDYWFVQFDFPDEGGRPYKSSGGEMVWNERLKREIPKGWEDCTLIDIANITMGQSPEGQSCNSNCDGIIFYQGSTDFGVRFPAIRQYTIAPTRFAKKGDILMSVRAPVGAMNIANNDCCIGRGLSAINSKIGSTTHLYYVISDFRIRFDGMNAAGTTFGSITKEELHSLPTYKPLPEIVKKFEMLCHPIFERQMLLGEEINSLTTQRDTLLPLLMNGQVSVNYDLSHD